MLNLKNEDFRKLETLFKVGNTEVNQVRISHLNQLCVVKIQKVNSIEEANSMSRECYSLASNSHSNIVKLIGCTLVGNERNLTSVMIFLEYCSQGPLNEHFNTFRDSINEDTIYYYLFQAVEALSFLQEREVSHRDIKPENILITDNGKTLKISDLGCCTKIDASTLTLKGTANYLSPKLRKRHELNQENAEYKVHHNSYKSDVFSLGLIILSMLQEGFNNTQYNRLDNLENLICEKVGKIKNQFFRQLIIKMLEFDEDRRMDFIELKDFLHQNHVILPEHFCQKCMKYCPSLTFRYIRGASFVVKK
jgi:serine/threonine protein kinase